jgi:hypothetical protein
VLNSGHVGRRREISTMNEHELLKRVKRTIGILYQRATHDRRENDMVDLEHLSQDVREIGDVIHALHIKADVANDIKAEYDGLIDAIVAADEDNPMVSDLAEAIRQEEWEESAKDGMMTPNELAEKLNALTYHADPEAVAVLVRALTGDALDGAGRLALVELIRRIAWEGKP